MNSGLCFCLTARRLQIRSLILRNLFFLVWSLSSFVRVFFKHSYFVHCKVHTHGEYEYEWLFDFQDSLNGIPLRCLQVCYKL